jgi:nicotinate-nucleotide pyrophosphorylase (carboxylating)
MGIDYFSLDEFFLNALREDIGTGDVTTLSCVLDDAVSTGHFIAKESGVICGLDVAKRLFAMLDDRIVMTSFANDGDFVESGNCFAEVSGNSRSILTGERTVLNLLQHLSAISTKTAFMTKSVAGTKAKIVDTRKTVPGLRVLAKYAVKCGGGYNHRMNLSDGILIKDNHIIAAGGIKQAVTAARENCPLTLKIEVETENLQQVREALSAGADIIMLDNMTLETMAEAVKMVAGKALTEASGNMDKKDLRKVAETGVDFISIGALTHSVNALDISLKFI